MGISYLLGGTIWVIPIPVFDFWNSTSGYRSWYGISVCICGFVVYWVVAMIPILLSTILFPSTTEILLPYVSQTERWSQIETCWYTRLGWRYYIDKHVGHFKLAKYAERWKQDQSSSVHGDSKVSSSSLASQIRMWCILFSSQLFSFEGNPISFVI
jgi:hypothetical protein